MKGNINEQRTAAASYILNFYNEVMVLKQQTALYINLIKRMAYKYPDLNKSQINAAESKVNMEKMEDGEKNMIIESSQASTYQVQLTYFSYKSIVTNMSMKEEEKIKILYQQLRSDLIINPDMIEEFCILMNTFLLNNIVQELLTNSSQFIDSVFNDIAAK